MRFSLIVATLGRMQEIQCLLASLDAQSHRDFELIVVDQNPDDRLVHILNPYQTQFPIVHLSSKRGLSRARNVGLKHATGEVVGFPDDDCWYSDDLLEKTTRLLSEQPEAGGVSGRVTDEGGTFDARFDQVSGLLEISNVWRRTSSASLFVRRRLFEDISGFDEELGVGSGTIWGGAEDIEYALRAVRFGFEIYYDPSLVVFHPHALASGYREMSGRAYSYGAGIGRVWRKHDYPLRLVSYSMLRPAGGAVLALLSGQPDKASYHWSAFRGRLRGWISRK